jgi:pyridoxine 5-phosphate synthase
MTKLSVNLNKFALIRNARGTDKPNVLSIAKRAVKAGAHGITVHPRPDQRHARYQDVYDLAQYIKNLPEIEFNVEGNPVEKFLDVVCESKPDQCTLVPDSEDQITSDHGWDVLDNKEVLVTIIARLKSCGIRVSLFLDAGDEQQVYAAKEVGADRIELYTEPYAVAFENNITDTVLDQFVQSAVLGNKIGLGINAGHDLNLKNLALFLSTVPHVDEISIGHAIVVESFDYSFEKTLEKYLSIVNK